MARNVARQNIPLSRFGVLVAQLESIVASASQQSPDPLLCFDLLSDLISAIDEEPKESILLWQRKCEDALYSLLTHGARRPVRHLASVAMAKTISKGDSISIYSRASSLQGFLSDGKKSEPQKVAGAAQCLGELYRHFGRRITSGLLETTIIATKLMKFLEDFVRREALLMLQNALEGSSGNAAASAYTEAFRLITKVSIGDKSSVVRIAAARCLKAFAIIGGPGLGMGELDNSASYCVKALEDPLASVRDAFAEALGSLLALALNPEAQVQPRGKGPFPPARKLEGGLQRHLASPFTKASGARSKDIRMGLTLSWVFLLQAVRLKYLHPDNELQNYALLVMEMLHADNSVDAHALACVLYILRVGITDQMTEPTQRSFLVFLGKQLQSFDASPSMKIAALRTLSYTLKTLGEVPLEFKEEFDNTVVASISHPSQLVRIEAALTLRVLAEVDPTCIGGLISYGLTTLNALRESVSFGKGSNLNVDLDSLRGQAIVLAALVSISPKLPLGYPTRLPRSVLDILKKLLTESSRNPAIATIEEEAGWLLLSSLLASMAKEELEDGVFDILSLWAALFSGNPEHEIKQIGDLTSRICVWSAAVDALTTFIRCFVSGDALNYGILLQPVMVYLSRALSYISMIQAKALPNTKPAIDILIIRTLIAYQSLPDPVAYKSDHPQIIQLCTTPYRDASGCEESSCLRFLLDKRDSWLGPWIPGRDWLEDELRAFQGGKDGLMPCVWTNELSSFPQPETINKTVVNQMLLCFGVMFASQDARGMLSLLGIVENCLKSGKKQPWRTASISNICVGLLAGLKALLALHRQPLGMEILNSAQAIFLSILAEGDICASHRRASSEGLGLLARLGNDVFTARMTRLLLGDLTGSTDSCYAGSLALALGCIHRSAGGMALSSLVPATVTSISSLAKSSITGLQIWSLHGLLLTIESAGFSYVSHVQATLGLVMDILLSEEHGFVDLQQGVGRLVNAIVAVLGPELAPGSIFFSRCKAVVAEISSSQETATMLESVRFAQQLVLFAPQAVSVHSHVQTLLSTLSSRQPTLRHLAVSTMRHLIEKDPVSIVDEQIEDNLFHMLDEETDSEIGNLIRTTIMRLLYAACPLCPSHWILICRNMVLAVSSRRNAEISNSENDPSNGPVGSTSFGEDDENMVSTSMGMPVQGYALQSSIVKPNREKHLRYRTRVFAAECLSNLPTAVGNNAGHFDLSLARKRTSNGQPSGDWLVLHLQELISVAYQISTIQFENMRPIGVELLSTIVDKFETVADPELPGHLLLEQYQAQLISAVRTALDVSSGPILLEAGLHLATKIMTSGILGGDQVAVKRIFSLISRPLNEFKDLYYPSFAEWVTSKIKIRLLAAHASLKCYTYAFLRRHHSGVPDEYLALLPLFSRSSSILGKYWISVLKDYSYICLRLNTKKNWNPFLDGIQSPVVSSKLCPSLDAAWPVILQALALDAVPVIGCSKTCVEVTSETSLISGYSMVELEFEDYRFLWGFSLHVLFQAKHPVLNRQIIPLGSAKAIFGGDSPIEETNPPGLKLFEIVLPVFQFFSSKQFFAHGFLTVDNCRELLEIFSYCIFMDHSWNSLVLSILSQVLQNCPEDFFEMENFSYLAVDLCLAYMFKIIRRTDFILEEQPNWEELVSPLFTTAKTLVKRFESKPKQLKSVALAFMLMGYKCIREASTELCFSKVVDFVKSTSPLLNEIVDGAPEHGSDADPHLRTFFGTCLKVVYGLTKDNIKGIHLLEKKRLESRKLLHMKLAFCLEHIVTFAKLAHEIEFQGDIKGRNPICLSIVRNCTKYIQTVITDSNMQVQAIGLQVLKNMVQRSTNIEDNSFLMFFNGELVGDIFTVMQMMLKKPVCKESVAVAGECLRFLVLLQTQPKDSEGQRGFMNLLLEAILMVFSVSENDLSQEVNDIKSTAIRLVSQLAQIPSSALHFKDALLSMPVTQRQQLQEVIRASVTQDHSSTQTKPVTPFEIKLPMPKDPLPSVNPLAPTEVTTREESPTPSVMQHDSKSMEEDEDDDDWDAFQSFPATANAAGTESKVEGAAERPDLVESPASEISTQDTTFQDYRKSESLENMKDMEEWERQEADEEEATSDSPGAKNENKDPSVFQTGDGNESDKEKEEKVGTRQEIEGQVSRQDNIGISSEPHIVEGTGKAIEVNLVENQKLREESADSNQVSSNDPLKVEDLIEVGVRGQDMKIMESFGSATALPEFSHNEIQQEHENKTGREQHIEDGKDAEQKMMVENTSTIQHSDTIDSTDLPKDQGDGTKLESKSME
ncbi:protein SWEETIE isoform X2 [Tripterygium wilfordii]|uniref:protein SWEETIE isoform X2 n=1 Tax=Tripterygium wilfordii TaxID=458696 RepID=UPI0018F83032|nr:protein SWEETIE isoform X2 [Tripterygium wilfordii]